MEQNTLISYGVERTKDSFRVSDRPIHRATLRAFRKYWKELAQDFASYCYWKTGDFQDIINCGANELGKT